MITVPKVNPNFSASAIMVVASISGGMVGTGVGVEVGAFVGFGVADGSAVGTGVSVSGKAASVPAGKYAGLGYSFYIEGNFMPEEKNQGVTSYRGYIMEKEVCRGFWERMLVE